MNKSIVKILSTVLPNLVVSFAYRQLTNPQVRKLRGHESVVLDRAKKESFPFKGFDIKLYEWGEGKKKILLIHGWEGQAGNFADLVEKLLEDNYTIYAFDGPSHGYSSQGKTSLFEFTELVAVLIKRFDVSTLVSHSFGGVATTYALFTNRDLEINKYLLLTTPDRFIERINDVSEAIGITEKVKHLLVERLQNETGQDVYGMNVSDFVQHINVKDALIIHDQADKVIPINRSKNVHKRWPVASFKEIEGTGHFRILRDEAVLDTVVDFLNVDSKN
ncbi:MAG: alpha/beta hydrolase [Bacteroidota bacterium]